MKIVDRQTFLGLPAGTIYAKVVTGAYDFGPLEIKGDTVAGVDFYSQRLVGDFKGTADTGEWADVFASLLQGSEAQPDFDIESRDGLFDQDQQFAVYSQEDATRLVERLQRAVGEVSQ